MSNEVYDFNIGHSTAYAYAKASGDLPEGMTPEEYGELLASYATVGQTAVTAAQTATTKASEAATSATTATTKASEAATSATTATNKAAEAQADADAAALDASQAMSAASTATTKASEATTAAATATSAKTDAVAANTAAQSAKTAAQTAQAGAETAAASVQSSAAQIATNAEDISQLKSDFADMQSDGAVPSAEQILTDKGITDSVPYHYRKTVGNGADRLYDQIVGGTVCWNQLLNNMRSSSTTNGLTFVNNNGALTITGTITEAFNYDNVTFTNNNVQFKRDGSKYLLMLNKEIPFKWGVGGYGNIIPESTRAWIWTSNSEGVWTNGLTFKAEVGQTVDIHELKASIFDLTAMLGSTIADYIYQLEQTTAGAGVAFFKSLFPNDYYEYNSGELLSVSGLSEHKMVGFNQFDKSKAVFGSFISDANGNAVESANSAHSDYIDVVGGFGYYIKSEQSAGQWGAWYDSEKNFISGITGYNSVKTAPLNARYMRGTVLRNDSGNINAFCVNLSDPTKNGQYEPYKAHSYPLDDSLTLRGLFKLDANNKLYADGDVYEYTGKVTRNTILRAYQSGDESLANAITDGTNTVVYSANASTEQVQPYQHLQQCDPNGTEEYVSTGIVPVGHNTQYPENLRAKIEGLPWNFANLIAPTEATFTATRNYTTGSLFIVDNVLYKATANIANGGTITPNTNCTATTLAEIISALA